MKLTLLFLLALGVYCVAAQEATTQGAKEDGEEEKKPLCADDDQACKDAAEEMFRKVVKETVKQVGEEFKKKMEEKDGYGDKGGKGGDDGKGGKGGPGGKGDKDGRDQGNRNPFEHGMRGGSASVSAGFVTISLAALVSLLKQLL